MSEPRPAPAVTLRHHREVVITTLCEHFAHDHLEAEELERLIDRAHRSTSVAELDSLLADLPVARKGDAVTLPPPPRVQGRQTVVAVMGGAERRGPWITSSRVQVVALMGGVVLDLRETRLPEGLTEVVAIAIMGGIEVIVPPGLRVVSDGFGILGGFEHASETTPVRADVPTLRISGLALMGGVEIVERLPGESEAEARRRRKSERTLRKEEQMRKLRGG
jgi:hypothetical protein